MLLSAALMLHRHGGVQQWQAIWATRQENAIHLKA
jgi:hypothetical protein